MRCLVRRFRKREMQCFEDDGSVGGFVGHVDWNMMATISVQSHVHAHVELLWLLSSTTPIGWLDRMIQFKEKSRKAHLYNSVAFELDHKRVTAAEPIRRFRRYNGEPANGVDLSLQEFACKTVADVGPR